MRLPTIRCYNERTAANKQTAADNEETAIMTIINDLEDNDREMSVRDDRPNGWSWTCWRCWQKKGKYSTRATARRGALRHNCDS